MKVQLSPERDAMLSDLEKNELNDKKVNIYTPNEKFLKLHVFH